MAKRKRPVHIAVEVGEAGLEAAIRTFKHKVQRSGLWADMKRKRSFINKGEARRMDEKMGIKRTKQREYKEKQVRKSPKQTPLTIMKHNKYAE